jgi:hypothetical protein
MPAPAVSRLTWDLILVILAKLRLKDFARGVCLTYKAWHRVYQEAVVRAQQPFRDVLGLGCCLSGVQAVTRNKYSMVDGVESVVSISRNREV